MKLNLRIGEGYAFSKHKLKHTYIRYFSLLAVATIMCLYARAQRLDNSGPVLSGIVTDTVGIAISGATIAIKGTSTKVLTDDKGRFTLHVPESSGTLTISHLGHQTINEKFDTIGGGEFHFTLLPLERFLEEVKVSTGYQSVARERFIGSASTLDSASFHRRAGLGILERMDGTIAGVVFDNKASGNTFQIRGISTLGGQLLSREQRRPLIILDGFPFEGDLSLINPNDVASITVLKDAAAASIWGAKAGNGVVVVNTFGGKFNKPIRISFRSNFGIQSKDDLFYFPRMNSSDFIEVEKVLYERGFYDRELSNSISPYGWPVVSPVIEWLHQADVNGTERRLVDLYLDSLSNTDTRIELNRHWYRAVASQQQYLNMSGGSERYSFSLSGGFNRKSSEVQRGDGVHEVTFSGSLTTKLISNLEIQAGINYTSRKDRTPQNLLPTKLYPYQKLMDDHGNALAMPQTYRQTYVDTVGAGQLLDWSYRPIEEVIHSDNLNAQTSLRFNIAIVYSPTDWLTAEARFQDLTQPNQQRNHYAVNTWEARDLINQYTNLGEIDDRLRFPVPRGGILNIAERELTQRQYRFQLAADHTVGQRGQLNAMIGAERSETSYDGFSTRYYGYENAYGTYKTDIDFMSSFRIINTRRTRSTIPSGQSYQPRSTNRFVSFIANSSFTWDKRYSFYASARRDGSNLFGVATNNKWKPLWSVGGSWELTQEAFRMPAFLNYWRVRTSYGYTGNVNNGISGFVTMAYIPITSFSLNNLPVSQLQNPPNPDLRWEQVQTINFGTDFRLFNNRLSGTIDYFLKKSTDLISPIPFDPTTGVVQHIVNSASLAGNGFEINLTSNNSNGVLGWVTAAGLAYAKMKVTKFYNGGFRTSDFVNYNIQPGVGMVAYGLASYRWGGLDPSTGDPQGLLNGQVTKDYSGIFNDSLGNQIFHGSAIPLYSGFVLNTVKWRNLSLSMNVTYRLGFYFRQPALNYSSLFNGTRLHADYVKRWQNPGDERHTSVPSMLYPVPSEVSQRDMFYSYSEIHVKKGDNIRLKDIRMDWQLAPFKKEWLVKSVQLFVYANNLNIILWKKAKGPWDPDYSGGSNAGAIPAPQSWLVGINLSI